MVVHYDYTVIAGTQGSRNHYKTDRLFELALRFRMLVLFSEGAAVARAMMIWAPACHLIHIPLRSLPSCQEPSQWSALTMDAVSLGTLFCWPVVM